MAEAITYLYRCFDRDGQLLYVGVSDNVDRRLRQHVVDKFWWGDVTKVTRMAFPRRIEALWAEWAVISTCHPIYNGVAAVPPVADQQPFVTVQAIPIPNGTKSQRRHRSRTSSNRPTMTDKEAIQAMLRYAPQPGHPWGTREVHRVTGAGFGRIPKLITAVQAHHARQGAISYPTSANDDRENAL
jgi:hypothetical protein